MWIQKKIREDLENIEPQCLSKLRRINALPQEKAVRIAAYLWEGCFQSSNDIWVTLCGGLLYMLPPEWLEAHVTEVLDRLEIDWHDEFEFYNLCPAFYHLPGALTQILAYAEGRIPKASAGEWLSDMREMMGSRKHFRQVTQYFEQMDKSELTL